MSMENIAGFLSVMVTIATVASFFSSLSQARTARNEFINAVHEKYLELISFSAKEEKPFNDRVKQLYANFYEYISWCLIEKRINKKDAELFTSDMINPKMVSFIEKRRKENSRLYENYWKWYSKNTLVNKDNQK